MKRLKIVAAAAWVALCSSVVFAQGVVTPRNAGGGGVSSGSAIPGCTSSLIYADASSLLKCDPAAVVNGSVSTAGRSILTIRDTATSGQAFLDVTGAIPASLSGTHSAVNMAISGSGQSQVEAAQSITFSGTNPTGGFGAYGLRVDNQLDGTFSYGIKGAASGAANASVGVVGQAYAGTFRIGGYFALANQDAPSVSGALIADNGAVAANIFEARDNGTATSTTAASANVAILDGAQMRLGNMVLTSGTMTVTNAGESRSVISAYDWTNAMVVALGAVGAGDITVATLPAKTVVKNAYVVILTPDSSANALTVACGRTSATYIDYIVASDAKAAANTVYGDASAERGTNLTGYDLPSYTGTTAVVCHFIKTTSNLSTVTGSTGRVILETALVP